MRVGPAGPVHEQRHRLGLGRISQVTGIGHRQRAQPVPGLPRHPQRLPAGRQDPQVITGRHQLRAQPGSRAEHVLAVIQHQQQLLAGQYPGQRPGERRPRLLPDPQRHRDHRRNLFRVAHRGQLHQPHPVREPARHLPGHLTGQPGLARTPRPGHRHQPVPLEQHRDLAHRPGPADEARQHGREAMHGAGRR